MSGHVEGSRAFSRCTALIVIMSTKREACGHEEIREKGGHRHTKGTPHSSASTAAKNNITDQARVYFRVRDIGGVEIKAASELSINPTTRSPEWRADKPSAWLLGVGGEEWVRQGRGRQITHLITKEYHRGVDGSWLKSLIEGYHHPNINARGGNKADEYLLSCQIRKYIEETPLADESRKHHLDNLNKVLRYGSPTPRCCISGSFTLCIRHTITAVSDIRTSSCGMQEKYPSVSAGFRRTLGTLPVVDSWVS